MNKKSQAFVFFIFLIGLIVIGLAISILMKPMNEIYNKTYNQSDVMEQDYQTFYTRTKTIWAWLPFVFALAMIVWVYIKSHERTPYG
jgi:amino acid transporter